MPTNEEMQAELERLRDENEALKQRNKSDRFVSIKVSDKGVVTVHGLGRFPVNQDQWLKLLATADEIKTFIEEKRARLKPKGE